MKTILITNDDGITADGIVRLARAAQAFGRVLVIAPEHQRSAASHSITIRETLDLKPRDFPVAGVTAWACSGTPADCVRAGIFHLMAKNPDAVLSGINRGYNLGADIQYSATAGAALEAAHNGILSIALSEPDHGDHGITDTHLPGILAELLARQPVRNEIINVNFPYETCRGILTDRAVSRDGMYQARYRVTEPLEGGGLRLALDGIRNESAEEGSDFRAILDGYISIGKVRNLS